MDERPIREVERDVFAEHERFLAALPELLERHRGRWVVFKDGVVQGVHDSHRDARADALRRYGLDGGFVIAEVVEEEEPMPMTAGLAFGVLS